MNMNVNAAPFVPFIVKMENAMFDRLEKQWMKNNSYIFEDEPIEYILKTTKNTPFEKCRGKRMKTLLKFTPSLKSIKELSEVRTYASII